MRCIATTVSLRSMTVAFFKKRTYLLAAVILTFALFAFAYFFFAPQSQQLALSNPSTSVHIVTLTEDGFVPEELVIAQNDKVIFQTDTGNPFWPASSLHPSHDIYPAFDAGSRIIPPENWEFVFDKIGRWKYHDHINAHATGVITVIDPNANTNVYAADLDSCLSFTGPRKQQCWDRQLETVLQNQGLDAAFDFFVQLYRTEPDVPKACHEWGHSLGEAAYTKYKETGELVLVPEASYCGYGYFHSFIAELVKDTGNFDGVLAFCKKVEAELQDELSDVASNCVHGVGHGTTAWLLENPENWGDFQKTADEGTAICEMIYTTKEELSDCYDGVFNELHLDLFNSNYGMDFNAFMAKNDPFWLCHQQKEAHKESCYFEFVGIFWSIFDLDFMKAIQYVVHNMHGLEERGPVVIAKIAADWIQFDIVKESQEQNIEGCRSIPEFLFISCMQGITNGFIQHGEPNNLHEKGFAFCNADYLDEGEKSLCFEFFLGGLRAHYTQEQFQEACALLEEQYRLRECATTS